MEGFETALKFRSAEDALQEKRRGHLDNAVVVRVDIEEIRTITLAIDANGKAV